MTSTPRKARIIREIVKDSHTSHWDLDMLSHAELEALMGETTPAPGGESGGVQESKAGSGKPPA